MNLEFMIIKHLEAILQRLEIECTYFIASEAGKDGGYWIATKEQDRDITLRNLILRAIRIKKNARKMKRKKLYESTI